MSKEVVVDPLTRIEGHLKVRAEVTEEGNVVDESAYSVGTLFRNFENIIKGHDPVDAIHISSRFCGVCYLAHATASTRALEELYDVTPPKQGRIMRNVSNAGQAVEDHAEIIYALWLPDLANPRYTDSENGLLAPYPNLRRELVNRFAGINDPNGPGDSYLRAVEARKEIAKIPGIINGMSPHPRTFVPGGITYKPSFADISKFAGLWQRTIDFVEKIALGRPNDPITYQQWFELAEEWSNSSSPLMDILEWINGLEEEKGLSGIGDVPLLLKYGALNTLQDGPNLRMHTYGNTNDLLMSFGAWEEWEDEKYLSPGIVDLEDPSTFTDPNEVDTDLIREDVTNSFYEEGTGGKPNEEETKPLTDLEEEDFNTYEEDQKYSWAKAPRYDGRPAEVGPLARMVIDDPTGLIPAIALKLHELGINPVNTFTREVARFQNLMVDARKALSWVTQLDPQGNFHNEPDWENGIDSEGLGMWEPPRGSLLHYVSTDQNHEVDKYQAVVPTTWNMSPRGENGEMGPYEQAINSIGPKNGSFPEEPENPVQIFHTIRSFDPCIACAIHTIDPDGEEKKFSTRRC